MKQPRFIKPFVNWGASLLSVVALFSMVAAPALAALAANSVNSAAIIDGQVKTKDIGKRAVTGKKIARGAIGSAHIKDGAVGSADIANDAVNSAKIGDGAIQTADLANGAVTDGKLAFSTKTKYLAVPSSAFVPGATSDYIIKSIGSATGETYLYMNSGAAWVYFRAPVNLPDGAEVTAITYNGFDNKPSHVNNIRLKRINSTDLTQSEMKTALLSDSAVWQHVTETGIVNPFIDNQNYSYVLQANIYAPAGEDHRLGSALITYKIQGP